MTLAEIRAQVRYRVGQRADLQTNDGLTSLDYSINAAYDEITHNFRFTELERLDLGQSAAQGDESIPVPTNAYAVLTVFNTTDSLRLQPLVGGWEARERNFSTTQVRPDRWVRFADALFFKQPADATYNFRIAVQDSPTELTAASASPVIPRVWHRGIIILAVRNMWNGLDEEDRADRIMRAEWPVFRNSVRTAKAIEEYSKKPRGLRVERRFKNRRIGV